MLLFSSCVARPLISEREARALISDREALEPTDSSPQLEALEPDDSSSHLEALARRYGYPLEALHAATDAVRRRATELEFPAAVVPDARAENWDTSKARHSNFDFVSFLTPVLGLPWVWAASRPAARCLLPSLVTQRKGAAFSEADLGRTVRITGTGDMDVGRPLVDGFELPWLRRQRLDELQGLVVAVGGGAAREIDARQIRSSSGQRRLWRELKGEYRIEAVGADGRVSLRRAEDPHAEPKPVEAAEVSFANFEQPLEQRTEPNADEGCAARRVRWGAALRSLAADTPEFSGGLSIVSQDEGARVFLQDRQLLELFYSTAGKADVDAAVAADAYAGAAWRPHPGGRYAGLPSAPALFTSVVVRDYTAPTSGQLLTAVRAVLEARDAGRLVVLHCDSGHGRTGFLAAVLQSLAYGESLLESFERLREYDRLDVHGVRASAGSHHEVTTRDEEHPKLLRRRVAAWSRFIGLPYGVL